MNKFRVGIIGVGNMGTQHLRHFMELQACVIAEVQNHYMTVGEWLDTWGKEMGGRSWLPEQRAWKNFWS